MPGIISQAHFRANIAAVAAALLLSACASPTARFDRRAEALGIERVEGRAVVFQRGQAANGAPIHVYLDGDGTPVLRHGGIARDPTSRSGLILDLMAADPVPSVLVGRPCYYAAALPCDPVSFTNARYSAAVVDHLARAVNAAVAPYPESPVVLIGYSGGGTLAMLAAPDVANVVQVVTLAANLDPDAWVAHHGYAPLTGSLNPANAPPLPPRIRQLHVFGGDDENTPAFLAERTIERQPAPTVEIVPGFDHECCWADWWARHVGAL